MSGALVLRQRWCAVSCGHPMLKGVAVRKKYVVELMREERERLLGLIRTGEAPARMLNRARVLLKADQGEHAGAWLVVEHGRDRDLGFGEAVPREAPYPGHGDPTSGVPGLVRGAQPEGGERGVALHDRRCPNEATQALPGHRALTED